LERNREKKESKELLSFYSSGTQGSFHISVIFIFPTQSFNWEKRD